MNSELTQGQSIGSTDNPQSSQSAPLANESSQFQNSASTDALKQNRPIQVISSGESIQSVRSQSANNASSAIIVAVLITVVIAVIAASAYYRRTITRQSPPSEPVPAPKVKALKETKVKAVPTTVPASVKSPKPKAPKGKKKLSRSKRHK